jgi:hypothetical protein
MLTHFCRQRAPRNTFNWPNRCQLATPDRQRRDQPPELPFTTSRAANGSGSDELDGPFSPAPPAPGPPHHQPTITIDFDNVPMNTRLRYRPHPSPAACARVGMDKCGGLW